MGLNYLKFAIAILAIMSAAACDWRPKPLDDEDIRMYVQAYRNIAEASPELERIKMDSNEISILTCKACYPVLQDAVVRAGYKDFTDFLIADARVHLAMHQQLDLEIAKMVGETAEDGLSISVEEFCAITLSSQAANAQEDIVEKCRNLKSWAAHLDRIGGAIAELARKLSQFGDIAAIARNYEAISAALTNPELVDEFQHGNGDFDD